MKKLNSFLLLFIVLGCGSMAQAAIRRVNNNPAVNAPFTTLAAAQTAASDGDTIHLEGTPFTYSGTFTVTKRLHIIGPGYFLAENPNTQANSQTARVTGTINFSTGSAGSSLQGVVLNSVSISVANVVIRRNFFNTGNRIDLNAGANNTLITQNYNVWVNNGSAVSGLLITNNYALLISLGTNTNDALIQHNVFRVVISSQIIDATQCLITNNIVISGSIGGSGNLFSHNLGNGTQFGTENGNQSNVDMDAVFVGPTGNSTDGQYQLAANSPAAGAGFNGVDAGMFGGLTPYKLSGIPPVPAVYELQVQPVGSNNIPISITLSVKSHN